MESTYILLQSMQQYFDVKHTIYDTYIHDIYIYIYIYIYVYNIHMYIFYVYLYICICKTNLLVRLLVRAYL